MKERFAKLIDVKSIMTLCLTAVFCYLAIVGTVGATAFLSIFTMIVGFYFGTQSEKKKAQTAAPAESTATLQEGTAVLTENTTPESTMHATKPPDNV